MLCTKRNKVTLFWKLYFIFVYLPLLSVYSANKIVAWFCHSKKNILDVWIDDLGPIFKGASFVCQKVDKTRVFIPVWTEEPILSNNILFGVFSSSSLYRLSFLTKKQVIIIQMFFLIFLLNPWRKFSLGPIYSSFGYMIHPKFHSNFNLLDNFKAWHWAVLTDMKTSTPPIGSCLGFEQALSLPKHLRLTHAQSCHSPSASAPLERCHWGLWDAEGGLKCSWQTGRFTCSKQSFCTFLYRAVLGKTAHNVSNCIYCNSIQSFTVNKIIYNLINQSVQNMWYNLGLL